MLIKEIEKHIHSKTEVQFKQNKLLGRGLPLQLYRNNTMLLVLCSPPHTNVSSYVIGNTPLGLFINVENIREIKLTRKSLGKGVTFIRTDNNEQAIGTIIDIKKDYVTVTSNKDRKWLAFEVPHDKVYLR